MQVERISDEAVTGVALDRRALAEEVRALSELSPWRAAAAILAQWLVIAGAVALAVGVGHWTAWVLAGFVIGTRQHALAVLMHDAAHYRLFRNRTLNDLVSDLFLGYPIAISTSLYRRTHLAHHRHVNTDADPDWTAMRADEDWRWPKLRWECLKLFAKDLVGLKTLATLKIMAPWSPWTHLAGAGPSGQGMSVRERICLLAFVAGLVALLWFTNGWWAYLLLWIVPSFTVLSAIFRLRSISEHLGLKNQDEITASRVVIPGPVERLVICPCGINYHLEHHMFPSVPFYNLPRLHKRLRQIQAVRDNAHVTNTYTGLKSGVLAELLK